MAVNSGMAMMLKSMGLDPEAITKSIGEFGKMVVDLKTQMDRIEAHLIRQNEGKTLSHEGNENVEIRQGN